MLKTIGTYLHNYLHTKDDGSLDQAHLALAVCFVTGVLTFFLVLGIEVHFVLMGKAWANFGAAATWSGTMAAGGVGGQIFKTIGDIAAGTIQKVNQYTNDSQYNTKPGQPVIPCPPQPPTQGGV